MKLTPKSKITYPVIVNKEIYHRRGSGVSILTIHFVNKTQRISS
jgi:hypothetical protein